MGGEAAEEEYVRPPGEREIGDFEPVTAEMLLDPAPGDWLMFRRTYDGQGHSPLDQVDAGNVGELRLAWSWAMADGVNQPTPLVYRGVMYLANPRNIVQALEADTGTLIWEYRRPLSGDAARGFNQLRNLAIWGDKIFVATKDAAMLALDARSGRPQLAGLLLQPGAWAAGGAAEPELPRHLGPGDPVRGGFGRRAGGPQVVRDARHHRPARQARRLRRGHDGGGLERRPTAGLPDRGADHRRRRRLRAGRELWGTRLPTSVQGFPISYEVDGVQYVAAPTGLGGGSPRFVPARVSPEIRYPSSGNGLFVFRLP